MMTVVDRWKSREVVLLAVDGRQAWEVAQCGNVGKAAGVSLVEGCDADIFLGGAQFLQRFNNDCSQGIGLCTERNLAPRSIEEGFLDSVAQLVRKEQVNGLACKCGMRDRFKQQVPHPPGKSGGIRNDMSLLVRVRAGLS